MPYDLGQNRLKPTGRDPDDGLGLLVEPVDPSEEEPGEVRGRSGVGGGGELLGEEGVALGASDDGVDGRGVQAGAGTPDDLAQVDAQPDSTRLLLRTSAGAHYVARSASGQLCLVRVPDGDVPSEVCVPNRVGADVTIGDDATGQVRLVADGAPAPSTADGWRTAGPNVWVKG